MRNIFRRKNHANVRKSKTKKGDLVPFLSLIGAFCGAFAVYYFLHETLLAFVLLAIGIVFFFTLLGKGKQKEALQGEVLEEEFVSLFTFFSIYIEDGLTVYSSLQELLKYASPEMDKRLSALLTAIDEDKTVTPYIVFADTFHNLLVREVMIAVYKMVDEGSSSVYLRQYGALFDSLASEKRILERERFLSKLGSVSFLPMIASGLTSALITIGVVSAIGGISGNVF